MMNSKAQSFIGALFLLCPFVIGLSIYIGAVYLQFLESLSIAALAVPLAFVIAGFVALLKAKSRLIFLQKISFGTKNLRPREKILYVLGYIFVSIGILIMLCISQLE